MENKERYIYWKCGSCGNVYKSDRSERHQMDYCDCGKAAVDAERWYTRFIGSAGIIEITEEEYSKLKKNNDN